MNCWLLAWPGDAPNGLRIGAATVNIVRPLMFVLLPITFPIAWLLDNVLGAEMRQTYNKHQLEKLLQPIGSVVRESVIRILGGHACDVARQNLADSRQLTTIFSLIALI